MKIHDSPHINALKLYAKNIPNYSNQIPKHLDSFPMQAECQLMTYPAELQNGIGRLDQGGTALPSRFDPTRNMHEGIQENASEIRFALDSLPREDFSNPYCPDEFSTDKSPLPAARMIWTTIPINRAIEYIECEPIIHRSTRISFDLL
jgi:hypothetical protein